MFGERAGKAFDLFHSTHHEANHHQTLASTTKSGGFEVYHIMSPNLLS